MRATQLPEMSKTGYGLYAVEVRRANAAGKPKVTLDITRSEVIELNNTGARMLQWVLSARGAIVWASGTLYVTYQQSWTMRPQMQSQTP